jgi:16S rRNA (guanine966-N2)-methyltransferase
MRIIAGKYRSRAIHSHPGADLRPTSDRLRETLFNVMAAAKPLAGTRWLDLFAGTGAVGIEALSRGAGHVTFVESSRRAATLIQKNLAALKIVEGFQLLTTDAADAIRELTAAGHTEPFDCCFLDPPYALQEQYALVLQALAQSVILAPHCIVIAEHDKRFEPGADFVRLQRFRRLKQGDSVLSFYRIA